MSSLLTSAGKRTAQAAMRGKGAGGTYINAALGKTGYMPTGMPVKAALLVGGIYVGGWAVVKSVVVWQLSK